MTHCHAEEEVVKIRAVRTLQQRFCLFDGGFAQSLSFDFLDRCVGLAKFLPIDVESLDYHVFVSQGASFVSQDQTDLPQIFNNLLVLYNHAVVFLFLTFGLFVDQ